MKNEERFVSPLIDIVFKTLWMRADDDLKEYFKRILEYALRRKIPDYHIGPNETGIVNIDNIANKVDMLKNLGRDDEFMTIIDKVEYEKLVHEAEKEDMKELGFDEGHEQGIEQGIKQDEEGMQIMFIKSMAANNIEISEIAKIANMSIEEVQKIINEK